jgi:hypothetical protein
MNNVAHVSEVFAASVLRVEARRLSAYSGIYILFQQGEWWSLVPDPGTTGTVERVML